MNAKLAAIKILENAKKALKQKIDSLEKADGKNTAQLNEFKGIPQPPTPKAPEKAIAPTPKIPQPKIPGMGKSNVYTSPAHGKPGTNRDLHARGVGDIVSVSDDKEAQEKSLQGLRARRKDFAGAKEAAKETLKELSSMPKPNLPKSERPLLSFLKKREGKVK